MTVPSPDNRSRPNVLLIICDDLGWGDLGCYGSTVNDTPRIDAMMVKPDVENRCTDRIRMWATLNCLNLQKLV